MACYMNLFHRPSHTGNLKGVGIYLRCKLLSFGNLTWKVTSYHKILVNRSKSEIGMVSIFFLIKFLLWHNYTHI